MGLVLISYRIYSKRISEYYLSQIESAAQSAKEEILPDMVENFWKEINTDDYIKVHDAALAERDETLIRDWMISRPSRMSILGNLDFSVDMDSYEDVIDLDFANENMNLYHDYLILIHALQECQRLFFITDAYIQFDKDGVTYNLADPDEDLFYIGTIESPIDAFADCDNNEYFPPTIYHSDFGWLGTTLQPLDETKDGKIPGYVGVDINMNLVVRQPFIPESIHS